MRHLPLAHGTWAALILTVGVCLAGAMALMFALTAADRDDSLRVTDVAVEARPTGERWLTGGYRNHTRESMLSVQLDLSFLDAAGKVKTRAVTGTDVLRPDEFATFELPIRNDAVVRFRVDRVTWRHGNQAEKIGPYPARELAALAR